MILTGHLFIPDRSSGKEVTMKVKRLLCAALILALVLVVGYQVVVRLMIGYKIEHSRFLNWCQTPVRF